MGIEAAFREQAAAKAAAIEEAVARAAEAEEAMRNSGKAGDLNKFSPAEQLEILDDMQHSLLTSLKRKRYDLLERQARMGSGAYYEL